MKNTRELWRDTSSTTGSKPEESNLNFLRSPRQQRSTPSLAYTSLTRSNPIRGGPGSQQPVRLNGFRRSGPGYGYWLLGWLRPRLARRCLGAGLPRVELGHYHHKFLRLVQLAYHVLQLASVVVLLLAVVLIVHLA